MLAQGHQVVSIFHLLVVVVVRFHICKITQEPRKCASDTVIQVLRRTAKKEDMKKGSVPRRPHRFCLGFCLPTVVIDDCWMEK